MVIEPDKLREFVQEFKVAGNGFRIRVYASMNIAAGYMALRALA